MLDALSGLSGLSGEMGGAAAVVDPTSLPGFKLWLKKQNFYTDTALTTAAAVSGTDLVAAWKDSGGGAFNPQQTTAAQRPVYDASGYQAAHFDGVDDLLRTAANLAIAGDIDCSIFVAFKPATTQQKAVLGIGTTAVGGNFSLWYGPVSANLLRLEFGGGNSAIFQAGAGAVWQVVDFHKTPGAINTTTRLFCNGTEQAIQAGSSVNTPAVVSAPLTLGSWTSDLTSCSNVYVGEVLVFAPSLSDADKVLIRALIQSDLPGIY